MRRDIVEWLRSSGHDTAWIIETSPGAPDETILQRANREGRIVLSADLDFGELTVRHELAAAGILLLRIGTLPPGDVLPFFQLHWPRIEPQLAGCLVVLNARGIRVRPLRS
jgi:predicted nuclease of predicted toxin-antitoxin system